jgi:hypothetical protein
MSQCQVRGGRPTPLPWLRRLGATLVVAASVLGGPVLAAGPAHAASSSVLHPEWVDGCEGCPGPLLLVHQELDQRRLAAVTHGVADGLAGLIAAHRADDPALARRLADRAIAAFTQATQTAGNPGFSVGTWDGDICPRRPWPWPWPGPPPHWNTIEEYWNDVQQGLSDGLTLLGEAALTRDVDRAAALRAAGVAKLDDSATGLESFQGCVG